MTRTLAAVLLAAIVGVAPAAVPVAGDDPFAGCPVLALAHESELRKPPPGFTQRQWEMMWELARCFLIFDDTFAYDDVLARRTPDCNLFEYLEGAEVAALVCD